MRRFHSLATVTLLLTSAAPALAADYQTTVAGTSPTANFRLTAPGTPSTVGGYTTTYTSTTGTGPGAPIASDPGNTGATFTGDNTAPSEVTTSLFGGIPGKGSVNIWANLSALPSTLGHFFTLTSEGQSGNDFDFQIETDNVLRFYTGAGENTAFALDISTLVGQWHMLTASYDATLGFRNIYVDGILAAGFNGSVNGAAKTSQFTIGYNDVFTGRDFAGSLDEVTVWNYGLNDDQVASIYRSSFEAATPPSSGAVPEPATWAMMIAGFGLVGGAMRTRRREALATA